MAEIQGRAKFFVVGKDAGHAVFIYADGTLAEEEIGLCSYVDDSLIGLPPDGGAWIWEGEITFNHTCYDLGCDCEPYFDGAWRRLDMGEVYKVSLGHPPWSKDIDPLLEMSSPFLSEIMRKELESLKADVKLKTKVIENLREQVARADATSVMLSHEIDKLLLDKYPMKVEFLGVDAPKICGRVLSVSGKDNYICCKPAGKCTDH